MTHDFDPARLDALVHLLLDGDLSAESAEELREILRGSAEARRRYRRATAIHCSLLRQAAALEVAPPLSAEPGEKKNPRRALLALAAAACLVLPVVILTRPSAPSAPAPIATLSGSTSAIWENLPLPQGHSFDVGRTVSLLRGFAQITFNSGVEVILEGPCRFEINSPDEMRVAHGRASVKVPPHVKSFQLDTPGGRLTDLGTEFGVAVGSGSEGAVVLTEVFDGEIEIPAKNTRRRLHSGDSLAIVKDAIGTHLVSTLDNYRIDLGDTARRLPPPSTRSSSGVNLALGKPVFAPAYFSKPYGSRFPPETLTDGRLNDSGSPGDWSFWLAPNGEHGEFTVDLLKPTKIGRIELQNTRNRTHGDRGLREFAILVSDDNVTFREIFSGELSRIHAAPPPGEDFPFKSFTFAPVTTRFVKLLGLSHFHHPSRPQPDENHGGGLNEILIFAP